MTISEAPEERATAADARYPWVVMGIVLVGSYLVVLDTTVLGVALRTIADDLHADESIGIDWVVTSYLIAVGICQPASAWMADRFGRKNVYLACLAVFTVASLLAGVAPNLPLLIAARVLQGFGGGALMPVGMTMVWDQFPPHRRGLAMGVHGVAVMAAPAFGPVFGGWVVTSASWRLLFLVNLPIGAIALVLAWRYLRDDSVRTGRTLDGRGWWLVSAAVIVIVIGFREAEGWGWTSVPTIAALVLAVVLVWAAIRQCTRAEHPILELGMFAVPTFRLVTIINCLMTVSMYSRVVFLPTELQQVYGWTAQHVGVLFMFGALAIAAAMPIGGWLTDRIGAKPPVVVGLVVVGSSLVGLTQISAATSEAEILFWLIYGGFGVGLCVSGPQVVAINSLPAKWLSHASTMNSLSRQVASAISTSVLAAVVVAHVGALAPDDAAVGDVLDAYSRMFWVASVAVGIGVVLAFRMPNREQSNALRRPEPEV